MADALFRLNGRTPEIHEQLTENVERTEAAFKKAYPFVRNSLE